MFGATDWNLACVGRESAQQCSSVLLGSWSVLWHGYVFDLLQQASGVDSVQRLRRTCQ